MIRKLMVVKRFEFAAAHFLPGYPGKCKDLHGHTFSLEIGVEGAIDEQTGMVIDFVTLKKVVNEAVIDKLDHKCLKDIKEKDFPYQMPTVENMIVWIKDKLHYAFPWHITFIRLWETPNSYAEWRSK